MTHGWPGSVVEFHEVIGPLADPTAHGGDAADAFHVVCPSLPGYGWSDKPTEAGWGIERIAAAWAVLMGRLGYERYGAQGGDWGAGVTTVLGPLDREHCVGIHLNMVLAFPDPDTMADLTPAEQAAIDSFAFYDQWDSGYSKQQSTRPQSSATGWSTRRPDSCAWIVEKLYAWTDSDGHPENVLTRDRMLDNVMAYWLPGTGASSARLYWESFARMRGGVIETPVAGTVFPKEIFRPSRRWAEQALHRHPLLERAGQGRPLRRLRAASALRRRGARRLPDDALTGPRVRARGCGELGEVGRTPAPPPRKGPPMSTDAAVTKDLIETLEDGKDGFAKGAEKLTADGSADNAATFREFSAQRERFADELRGLAQSYGDDVDDNGSVAAAVHRGWMSLKDALSGDDPQGVLDVAEQGEDHAVKQFEKALTEDITPGLRTVVERQLRDVQAAHDTVRSLRDANV